MSTAKKHRLLELDVSDFGPISSASIALRPLTVFVGPSNTGKSYLAILIYALHRFFGIRTFGLGPGSGFSRSPHSFPWEKSNGFDFSSESITSLLEFIGELRSATETRKSPNPFSMQVPEQVAEIVFSAVRDLGNSSHDFSEEIRRCFGSDDVRQLIRRSAKKGTKISLRSYVSATREGPEPFEFTFSTQGAHSELNVTAPGKTPLLVEGDLREWSWFFRDVMRFDQGDIDKRYAREALNWLWNSAFPYMLGRVYRPAHYLPADRTGVMHAHRIVVRSLIETAPFASLRESSSTMPSLSGVMADFLARLVEFDDSSRTKRNRNSSLIRPLEDSVLTGTIHVERSEIGYPHFYYIPAGWKKNEALPLMHASSMVSELAPVVLFLRHVVAKGDLLIIEEPESHLHPAMQAAFARQLALVVKAGIHVIVTTHSEWILDQFSNLVRLSALPEAERGGLEGSAATLHPEQFGAWLFKRKGRPKGSVVEEIRVDPEAGGLLSDYGEVADQLYNTWAEIENRITEGKGNSRA